jgi:hypothetical protein
MKVYRVRLLPEERKQLQKLLSTGKASARTLTHARILLKADEGVDGPCLTDDEIAESLDVNRTMVERVRRYVRYRLSYAEVSEWLAERGVLVDQSTIYRWVQRFLPLFGEAARKHRGPIGPDWRVDETYARIRGRWHTSIAPSTGTVRSRTPMCRRHATWLPLARSRVGSRVHRQDTMSGHHRQGGYLSASAGRRDAWCSPSDRSVPDERHRA